MFDSVFLCVLMGVGCVKKFLLLLSYTVDFRKLEPSITSSRANLYQNDFPLDLLYVH